MNLMPTSEARIMAVLAHASALVTGLGLPLPVIGWSEQRRKSNYASFQCLQALGYQSLGYTVWLLLTLVIMLVLIFGLMIALAVGDQNPQAISAIGTISAIITVVLVFGLLAVYYLLPVIAAVACALGRDFRYPFMGNRLAEYLEFHSENEGWLNEEHEDRWVAAMSHFSVIVALWGMLAPITAWAMEGKRSPFLKFQSVQALLFQGVVLLISLAAGVIYFVGFILFASILSLGGEAVTNSSGEMVAFGVLIASMLVAALIVLIVPLFHILGQWAGYRVLKGDDYRYPVLGTLVARWVPSGVAKYTALATESPESAEKNL